MVVIGAGLAGLRCAARLAQLGRSVVLLEAEDVVGGRQHTDEIDGFLLDRGFHVLNPGYPAVARWVDVDALSMATFPAGVRVRREGGVAELTHPLRHPGGIPRSLRSGLLSPRELVALARWLLPALVAPQRVIASSDRSLRQAWDRLGVRGPLRHELLEPFLAGVLAEGDGASSDAFTRLLVRMFALGRPGVPARGIAALPAQLARRARAEGVEIRLGARVGAVRPRGGTLEIDVDGADPVTARAVVVAVGPDAVADLTDVPRPATHGLQTWWFAADEGDAPPSALISVDGRRRGPLVNTVVMTRTAASYGPPGQHLVQGSCLLPAGGADAVQPDESAVRRHLAEVWGVETSSWALLRRDDIPDALPAQEPPLQVRRPARVAEGLYVAGDHRDTASIQGALVSGDRVARAVQADLLGSGRG